MQWVQDRARGLVTCGCMGKIISGQGLFIYHRGVRLQGSGVWLWCCVLKECPVCVCCVCMGACVGVPWEVCWPPVPGCREGERNLLLVPPGDPGGTEKGSGKQEGWEEEADPEWGYISWTLKFSKSPALEGLRTRNGGFWSCQESVGAYRRFAHLQNWKWRADSLWICVLPRVQLFASRG